MMTWDFVPPCASLPVPRIDTAHIRASIVSMIHPCGSINLTYLVTR